MQTFPEVSYLGRKYELGVPHFLPTASFDEGLAIRYQAFRRQKRQENFDPVAVVPESTDDFDRFLRKTKMTILEFSEAACLPVQDVQHALYRRVPATVLNFFKEINDAEDD